MINLEPVLEINGDSDEKTTCLNLSDTLPETGIVKNLETKTINQVQTSPKKDDVQFFSPEEE